MKTVLEEFIEAAERGLEKKFPDHLKREWLNIERNRLEACWSHGKIHGLKNTDGSFEDFERFIENKDENPQK